MFERILKKVKPDKKEQLEVTRKVKEFLVEDYDLAISDEDPDGITSVIIYCLYKNKEIDSILEKSLSHNGPVVIEAIIDHTAIPPAHKV